MQSNNNVQSNDKQSYLKKHYNIILIENDLVFDREKKVKKNKI